MWIEDDDVATCDAITLVLLGPPVYAPANCVSLVKFRYEPRVRGRVAVHVEKINPVGSTANFV